MSAAPRALVVAGAVFGLAGVALSAAAAHVTGPGSLATAANFLLWHAPVLLVLGALDGTGVVHRTTARLAAGGIFAGTAVFASDLATRALTGAALLPMAAPTGGVVLMAGWALLAVAALLPPRFGIR